MNNQVINEKVKSTPQFLLVWNKFIQIAQLINQLFNCVRITVSHIEVFYNKERWIKNAQIYGIYLQWNSLVKDYYHKDFMIIGQTSDIYDYLLGLKQSFTHNGPIATCEQLYLQLVDFEGWRVIASSFLKYINSDLPQKSNDVLKEPIEKTYPELPTEAFLNQTKAIWLINPKKSVVEGDGPLAIKIFPDYVKAYKEHLIQEDRQQIKGLTKSMKPEKSKGR